MLGDNRLHIEFWEQKAPVINEGMEDWEIVLYQITLTGLMPPHCYPDQKILYQIVSGRGSFVYNHAEYGWLAAEAKAEGIFTPNPGQGHFFVQLDEEPLVISTMAHPSIMAKRRLVELPGEVSAIAHVTSVGESFVMCDSLFGEVKIEAGDLPKIIKPGDRIKLVIPTPPVEEATPEVVESGDE